MALYMDDSWIKLISWGYLHKRTDKKMERENKNEDERWAGKSWRTRKVIGDQQGFCILDNKVIPRLFKFLLLLMSYAGMDKSSCMIGTISAISVLLCKYPQLISN